ncbi:unnamed protein product [marine sediment metagenome]|uniref:Uncharacterized protein n=1 Tax=marine sediment metagenome TaxID=412755 RepID=X1TJ85_9ZZZZ
MAKQVAEIDMVVTFSTTINLQQAAGTYDLFTGMAQEGSVKSLLLMLPDVDVSDDANIAGISIQVDDATPQIFFDAIVGAKANLTAEAQLAWIGNIAIKAGSKIRLTIYGGPADVSTICDVTVEYRAKVNGGYLA